MGGQVYDRESIEKMYGKGGENFPGRPSFQAALRHVMDSPAAMQSTRACRDHTPSQLDVSLLRCPSLS